MSGKDNNQFTINIASSAIIKTVVILLAFWFLYFVRDLVVVILTSLVIASGIEPIVVWLKKYHIARTISVILVYLFLALVLSGIFYFFVPALVADISDLFSKLPSYLDTVSVWNPFKDVINSASPVSDTLNLSSGGFSFGEMMNQINTVFGSASSGFIGAASAIFGGVLGLVLIVVLSFYLAVQEDGVARFLKIVLPVRYEPYILDLWRRAQSKIGKWLQGQLLLGVLIGILVYLGLTVLGVRNALVLALLAAAFEIIPIFGPILAAIPATIIGLIDGGVTMGLLVVGLYVLIQQFENHLIYPLVVRKVVGIPPIIVILAVIVGFKLAGVLGVILSVPIAAVLVELLDDVQRDKQRAAAASSISQL